MLTRLSMVTLAVLPLLTPAANAEEKDQPREVGELFCKLTQGGAQFAPQYLLTRGLLADIATALKKNDDWAAAHQGDKPPLGDGIQFASFPDAPPVCRVGEVTDGQDGTKLVDIQYVAGGDPQDNWADRLVLKTEDGLPRIDDVLYGVDKYQIGLRKSLVSL